MTSDTPKNFPLKPLIGTMFLTSFALVLFELLLTRLFGVVLFAQFAHLALGLALLGISIGSVVQHLWPQIIPEEGMEERLAWMVILMCGTMLIAVVLSLNLPVIHQFERPPTVYQERSAITGKLLNGGWFALLLPFLALPFVFAGIIFSGAFYRRKKDIGTLYGADLVGGAVGALAFIPLLSGLAGPDVVFVAMLSTSGAAAWLLFRTPRRKWFFISVGVSGVLLIIAIMGLAGVQILQVRYAAGYSEKNVTYTRWTPLTRLAVHEDERGKYILLDNASASEVLITKDDRDRKATEPNRSLVYQLHKPPGRVAVLASSAGPEVAIAQKYGFRNIDAVDIAGEIAEVVRQRFPDAPINPFIKGNTRQINADGRAAILHAKKPYDIIQMVHANLHSNAGLLASTWSPSLMETKEAFITYFSRLSENGTISFGKGPYTRVLVRSAAEALVARGSQQPWRHIAYLSGPTSFMLVKKRMWTRDEVVRLRQLAAKNKTRFGWDPAWDLGKNTIDLFVNQGVLTDDKPYLDHIGLIPWAFKRFFTFKKAQTEEALESLYGSLVIQGLFVFVAGILFLFIPLMRRGPTGLLKINGVGTGLLYVTCLGYGYLAVETVLIHELVLFIGHPTYAVTIVIMSMLLFSGIGSITAGRVREVRLTKVLQVVLMTALVLGAVQAFVVPGILNNIALGLPIIARLGIVFFVIAPLGFVMGMPFPLAMRIIPEGASGIIPWAWALNGWMSVVASLVTVVISRTGGYSRAFMVALAFYLVALFLSPRLKGVGRIITYREQ